MGSESDYVPVANIEDLTQEDQDLDLLSTSSLLDPEILIPSPKRSAKPVNQSRKADAKTAAKSITKGGKKKHKAETIHTIKSKRSKLEKKRDLLVTSPSTAEETTGSQSQDTNEESNSPNQPPSDQASKILKPVGKVWNFMTRDYDSSKD